MMDDPILSFKRYWGNDASDDRDNKGANVKLKEILEQAKKRKLSAEKVILPPTSSLPDAGISFKDSKAHTGHNTKKRKINHSVSDSLKTWDSVVDSESVTNFVPEGKPVLNASSFKDVKLGNEISLAILNDSGLETASSGVSEDCQLTKPDMLTDKAKKKKENLKKSIKTERLHTKDYASSFARDDTDLQASQSHEKDSKMAKNLESAGDPQTFTVIGEVKNQSTVPVKRMLPEWLANPTIIRVNTSGKKSSLSELDYLDENIKKNLERQKIKHLFPVQVKVVPWLMQSNLKRLCVRPSDICVSAPTGSGKTLAFVLPIVQSLKPRVVCQIRALVVLPVGDLALQVFKVFEQFCKGTNLQVALVVGQRSFVQEQSSLVKKGVRGFHSLADIVVATPGRLIYHINRTPGLTLEYLKYLVIDEADRMMEEIQQGFLKTVEKAIFKDLPSSGCGCFSTSCLHKKAALPPSTPCAYGNISEPLQKLLYSATLSQDPEMLHELSLFQPKLFTSVAKCNSESVIADNIIGQYTTPKGLVERYVSCVPSIRPLIVSHLVCAEHFRRVLCFTNSVDSSHRLRLVLSNMGDITVREISSRLASVPRKIILEQFSSGKVQVLVCTDMMARGMDIENVDCVISYDAPESMKTYVHRVGRTARAGHAGSTVTLLEENKVQKFIKMLTLGGKKPPELLEIDFEAMQSMEEKYKRALDATSKTIQEEKRKMFLQKESGKNSKFSKSGKFRKNVNRKNYNNERKQ